MIQAQFEPLFESWRDEARRLILEGVAPEDVSWGQQIQSLLSFDSAGARPLQKLTRPLTVPPAFLNLAETISYARDDDRWDLLYRILFRLQHENPNLLQMSVDKDILRTERLRHSIARDIHKMHAFVRFKLKVVDGVDHYVAWHQPEHLIIRPGAEFFVRRFGDRPWSIFTPDGSAHWNLTQLSFGPGIPQNQFKVDDDWDEVWKTYYKSIFNPARLKIKMMKQEMSPKYWASMPETELIRELVREAPSRLQKMADNQNRMADVDPQMPLASLREKARSCQACPLAAKATHTVFGVGPDHARIMIVGEQPGDQEDLSGLPFVGPAGTELDQALAAAGLDRGDLYLTNAVKHFKWTAQDKIRLHQRASGSEMHACKPWLEAEIAQVQPNVIVALGITAATAILGRMPKIGAERGRIHSGLSIAPAVVISWHPAAILRSRNAEEIQARRGELEQDLALAANAAQAFKTPSH